MTIHPLVEEEAAYTGATHRAIVTFADLAALTGGNGAQTINLAPVGINSMGSLVYTFLKTPFTFSDATLISNAVIVGDSGSTNRYLTSMETANAAAPATIKGGVALNPDGYVYAAADNFIATFTPTGGKNLDTATAGEIHFYLNVKNALPV